MYLERLWETRLCFLTTASLAQCVISDSVPMFWNQSRHHLNTVASVSKMMPDMLPQPLSLTQMSTGSVTTTETIVSNRNIFQTMNRLALSCSLSLSFFLSLSLSLVLSLSLSLSLSVLVFNVMVSLVPHWYALIFPMSVPFVSLQ